MCALEVGVFSQALKRKRNWVHVSKLFAPLATTTVYTQNESHVRQRSRAGRMPERGCEKECAVVEQLKLNK